MNRDSKKYDLTVLCVEDNKTTSKEIELMIGQTVKAIHFAVNGKEGYELFMQYRPDIVLTDINMPLMDGLELTREIRKIDADVTIIAMTNDSDSDMFIEAINSKISRFIPKPLCKDVLEEMLVFYALEKRKEHENSCNALLLEQYKSAVDESTIVSKADARGIITYVNDAFCSISGYSRDELIGKSHNIIRHPDVDATLFKELWHTITSGATWKGRIVNRAKDGSSYVVDSTIKPIVDRNGSVLEYISIRHDVTQIINLKQEIEDTQKEILYTLGELAETHSLETGNHVKRVAEYSRILATGMGLSADEVDLIYHAAPMHDIGKVAVSEAILNKPAALDPDEWTQMQSHTQKGYNVFKNSSRDLLAAAATIAHEHHEFWNGNGYPRGLEGEAIHPYGRIVALADVFDALSCDRVYKKGWELIEVKNYILQQRGTQFDPELVDIFEERFTEFQEVYRAFRD